MAHENGSRKWLTKGPAEMPVPICLRPPFPSQDGIRVEELQRIAMLQQAILRQRT